MAFIKTLVLAVLASTAAAQTNIGLIAAHSASPVHLQAVEAMGEKFYIGRATTTFCPSFLKPRNCPPGKETVFTTYPSTSLAMAVSVPGGQIAYIAPDGSLSFTRAHSSDIPRGSYTTGFVYTPGTADGSLGNLRPAAGGATTWLACQLGDKSYQVFANLKTVKFPADCIGFNTLAITGPGSPAAWQYV